MDPIEKPVNQRRDGLLIEPPPSAADANVPTVQHLAAGAHQVVDNIAGAAREAAANLEGKGDELRDAQVRITEACREHVRDNPMTSLGIAVAAGFLLSWALRSR